MDGWDEGKKLILTNFINFEKWHLIVCVYTYFCRTDRTVEIKHGDAGSLSVSGYDASKPVVFILHGGSFTPFNFQNELKPGAYVATLRDGKESMSYY